MESTRKKILILCDAKSLSAKHSVLFKLYTSLDRMFKKLDHIRICHIINKLRKKNEVVVLALDAEAQYLLKYHDISHKTIDDYLNCNDRRSIDEDVMSFVRDLEKSESLNKAIDFHGISLWNVVELELYGFFGKIIREYELLKRAINNERPDVIILRTVNIYDYVIKAITENIYISSIRPRLISCLVSRFTDILMPYGLRYLRRRWRIKHRNARISVDVTSEKGKVVILSDMSRHIPMVLPWATEIRNKGYCVKVIGLKNDKVEYEKHGVNFDIFSNYMTDEIYRMIDAETAFLEKKYRELHVNAKFREKLSYRGLALWKLTKNEILYLFFERFLRMIDYIETTKHIIDVEKPDVMVVLDERSGFGRAVVTTGKLKSIPTLVVQHGLIVDHPIFGPSLADKIAVFGDYTKEVLIKRGVRERQIVVTGQPRFDRLITRKFDERIHKLLNLDGSKNIIVLTTEAIDKFETLKMLHEVMNIIKNFPELQLVIKLHPDEDLEWYRSKIAEIGVKDAVIVRNVDLRDVLNICEILITRYSTTALEAMILNKHVICLDIGKKMSRYIPYVEEGAAIGVYNYEDLAPAIKNILYNHEVRNKLKDAMKKFVYNHAYKQDGGASKRVANLIEQMVQEYRRNKNEARK